MLGEWMAIICLAIALYHYDKILNALALLLRVMVFVGTVYFAFPDLGDAFDPGNLNSNNFSLYAIGPRVLYRFTSLFVNWEYEILYASQGSLFRSFDLAVGIYKFHWVMGVLLSVSGLASLLYSIREVMSPEVALILIGLVRRGQ